MSAAVQAQAPCSHLVKGPSTRQRWPPRHHLRRMAQPDHFSCAVMPGTVFSSSRTISCNLTSPDLAASQWLSPAGMTSKLPAGYNFSSDSTMVSPSPQDTSPERTVRRRECASVACGGTTSPASRSKSTTAGLPPRDRASGVSVATPCTCSCDRVFKLINVESA